MRSRRRKASRTPLVAAAVVVLAAGGATAHLMRRPPAAPPERFAIWKLQAGGDFTALEERLWMEQRRKFSCRALVGRNRLCEIPSAGQPTTGTAGTVRAVVDSLGTVAVVQFRAARHGDELRVQARAIEQSWRHDVDTVTTRWDALARVADRAQLGDRYLWRSADRTAAAWLERDASGRTAALTVADEAALAGVRAGADLGAFVLEQAALDHARSGGEGELRHTAQLGPAAERSAVPLCPPQYRHPRPGTRVRDTHSAAWLSLLQRSVPLAYPGTTLDVGDGLSLVRGGVPERLVAEPSSDGFGKSVAVYAMQLPDRAGIAGVREQPGLAAACRVPAELLLVQLDTAGAPLETYRLLLDGEATLARIDDLRVLDADDGGPGVHVEYTATYDTPHWFAQVVWSAAVQLNEPRVRSRVPAVVVKKVKATGEERRALTVVRAGASPDSVRVSLLEQSPATRTLVIPQKPGAPLDAYALLERF